MNELDPFRRRLVLDVHRRRVNDEVYALSTPGTISAAECVEIERAWREGMPAGATRLVITIGKPAVWQ